MFNVTRRIASPRTGNRCSATSWLPRIILTLREKSRVQHAQSRAIEPQHRTGKHSYPRMEGVHVARYCTSRLLSLNNVIHNESQESRRCSNPIDKHCRELCMRSVGWSSFSQHSLSLPRVFVGCAGAQTNTVRRVYMRCPDERIRCAPVAFALDLLCPTSHGVQWILVLRRQATLDARMAIVLLLWVALRLMRVARNYRI